MRPILFLSALFLALPAWAAEVALHAGPHTIHAEVAATPEQREHGLMRRANLCADCGMLFVFPAPGRHSFWMKNTPLPLSIAFIAADGRVLNIEDMQPETLDVHTAAGNALYSLEMPQGWFTRHQVKAGDAITGLAGLSTDY